MTNRSSVTYTQYTIYITIYTLFMHSGSMLMIFLCIHFIHIIFIYTNRKALSFVLHVLLFTEIIWTWKTVWTALEYKRGSIS